MKKILLSAAVVATLIAGCKKDSDKKTETPINTVPTSFTQKTVIEEFTGAWCGWCVDGHYRMETMTDANPTKVFGVCVHYGDGMQISSYDAFYKPTFSISGFPTGMVSRTSDVGGSGGVVMSRNLWEANVNNQLTKTAKCGLKIDASSISGNTLTVNVTAGFCAPVSDVNMTVMLIEDKVTGTGSGYDQKNYYAGNSSYSTHPFYSKSGTIVGYEHTNVLRKIASADAGDPIGAANQVAGGSFTKSYTIDLSSVNKANCQIVAVINGPGPGGTGYTVYNAQQVPVGGIQAWD